MMKALVIYDSQFGNTEKIARAIGAGFTGEVKVMKVGDVKPADIAWSKFVVIGSPTQGGKPTAAIKAFIDNLPNDAFTGKRLAAFDTRAKSFIVKLFGWAGDKIEASLKGKGGNPTAKPAGFLVASTKGPLLMGEEEKATAWAKAIAAGSPTGHLPSSLPVDSETIQQSDKIE
jgi:flavodoxin I